MPFEWTEQKEIAAFDLAHGELTKLEITAKIGVADKTIYNWLSDTEFAARVETLKEQIRTEILKTGIGDRVQRVKRLQKRWNQIGKYLDCQPDESKPDVQIVKEEREIAKQAAIELSQWTEKVSHDFGNLSDAELIQRAKSLFAGATEAGARSE